MANQEPSQNRVARCVKHDKEYEAFCMECNGKAEPLCPMCLCAHNAKHFKGNTHITVVIKEDMKRVATAFKNLDAQANQLKQHSSVLQKGLKKKNEIKATLEGRLGNMRKYIDAQANYAKEHNAKLLSAHETALKEIKKCENKIKENQDNPERIQQKVDGLIDKQKCWEAFKVVENALEQDAVLDDSLITEKSSEFEAVIKNYEEQLDEIEKSAAIVIPAYKGLFEENKAHIGKPFTAG